jgi:hypothetical protein
MARRGIDMADSSLLVHPLGIKLRMRGFKSISREKRTWQGGIHEQIFLKTTPSGAKTHEYIAFTHANHVTGPSTSTPVRMQKSTLSLLNSWACRKINLRSCMKAEYGISAVKKNDISD